MTRISKLFILSTVVLLAGCSSYYRSYNPPPKKPYRPPPAKVQPARPPAEVYVPKQPTVRKAPATPSSPAVVALLDAAKSERQSGELDSAVATLERAIHIQPRNAMLWQQMAELRLEQHKPRLALDLARKSNTLASGNRALKSKNWQLIAQAKRLLGDPAGAASALEKAER